MPQQEGVIKFDLTYRPGPPPAAPLLHALNAWRSILYRLALTGRDPARYDGLGYGNVSCRIPPYAGPALRRPFIISATQTGGVAELTVGHYTTVLAADPAANRVEATGPLRPSSEALSHAALYALDSRLRCVLHVHSPDLWHAADRLGLPATDAAVPYGTPAMAAEIARLYADPAVQRGRILAMGGHEDGLIAFGATPAAAGSVLLQHLARALEGERS